MNQSLLLPATMTFEADTEKELDLPTVGLITRIDLEVYLYASADMATDMSTLGMWRIIDGLKIIGGGGKNYFNMYGAHMGMMLHYLNLLDFPGDVFRSVTARANYLSFRLHFGSRPRDIYGRDNPFDLTAAIPANKNKTLKLIWDCANSAATDDTITVTDTTTVMRVTVHQVLDGEKAWSGMIPVSSTTNYNPTSTKDALSGTQPIPTGKHVRRIVVMSVDETAESAFGPIHTDDQLTELGVKLVRENRQLISTRVRAIEVCGGPLFDGATTVNTPNTQNAITQQGLYNLDLRKHGHRDYGLDARTMLDGDLELGMTIGAYTAGDDEYVWFDQLQKVGG